MAENERRLSLETGLYNNPSQIVIRTTADFLDNLQDAPWLIDRDSARQYLGTRSVPFVRAARENFPRLPSQPKTTDRLLEIVDLAEKIPHRTKSPEEIILEGLDYRLPQEPLGFTIVILANMSEDVNAIPGFTKPESPAEVLAYLQELEKTLIGVALDKLDPAEESHNPSYQRMKSFFTHGRRIPVKYVESEKERQERFDYDLNKLFGYTT